MANTSIDLAVAEVRGMEMRDPWRRGWLLACSVEPGTGQGERTDLEPPSTGTEVRKVSATEFAERVNKPAPVHGFSRNTILRELRTWEAAAAQGLVTPAASLTPADLRTTFTAPTASWSDMAELTTAQVEEAKAAEQHTPSRVPTSPSRRPSPAFRVVKPGLTRTATSIDKILKRLTEVDCDIDPEELQQAGELFNRISEGLAELRSMLAPDLTAVEDRESSQESSDTDISDRSSAEV